ncbi:MAG: gamma-glutamylcyclotransferase [Chitinivibrionales bacterium]|nr:gamma-glutamylcyclotransferase [Chitinivibrionales bacterium]MBD3358160.1 gamma-glutamylcyclotransferase [Chitinivibrionales bacterium]
MENLFAYGTLMCKDIMAEVGGIKLRRLPGIAKGYRRMSVKGEQYPALIADDRNQVKGFVYRDVPAKAWSRLDRFEGEMYARRSVRIELNDGTPIFAGTYLAKPAYLCLLENSEWSYLQFLRSGKKNFEQHYQGFSSLGPFA